MKEIPVSDNISQDNTEKASNVEENTMNEIKSQTHMHQMGYCMLTDVIEHNQLAFQDPEFL